MQPISKKDAQQNFTNYLSSHPEAITLHERDYDLILQSKSIFFSRQEISTSESIDLKNPLFLEAESIFINFTLFEDYEMSFIAKTMEEIGEIACFDANIMLSTTPTKKCAKSDVKLDIYLGFN